MRWHIIKTLLHKEALRHLGNRGGLVLALLLLVLALLLSIYNRSTVVQAGAGFIKSVHHCQIDYWCADDDPWVTYLKAHVPESLRAQVHFRNVPESLTGQGDRDIQYPTGTGAIQLRPTPDGKIKIWCWYPGEDRSVMAPFENWFWNATRQYHLNRLEAAGLKLMPLERYDVWVWRESHQQFLEDIAAAKAKLPTDAVIKIDVPEFLIERTPLTSKPVGTRTTISVALVLFALFFVCVYMLPSLACEEREKGVLLAQALSPASPLEILSAKLLFYPTTAMLFAAALGGLTNPVVLARPMFWMSIVVLAFGSMGVGMTISCLAKNQRSASMIALCYLLVLAMAALICQQNNITFLPQLSIEHHGSRLLLGVINNTIQEEHYFDLGYAAGLALLWNIAAAYSFRKFGWQ